MTVVVALTLGFAELVAVTDSGKLPWGVPWTPVAPRQPANVSTASRPTESSPTRSLVFRRAPVPAPPVKIPTSPSSGSGSSSAAYNGAVRVPPVGSGECSAAVFPVVVAVIVTVDVGTVVSDGGLNVQVTPKGTPGQANVIAPSGGFVDTSTVNENDTEPPGGTMALPLIGVIFSGGPRVVGSLAVSFAVLVSPPPDTVAVFVKLF